jgi:hypothetical protein
MISKHLKKKFTVKPSRFEAVFLGKLLMESKISCSSGSLRRAKFMESMMMRVELKPGAVLLLILMVLFRVLKY